MSVNAPVGNLLIQFVNPFLFVLLSNHVATMQLRNGVCTGISSDAASLCGLHRAGTTHPLGDGFWSTCPPDRSSKWKPSNLYEFVAKPRTREWPDLGNNAI